MYLYLCPINNLEITQDFPELFLFNKKKIINIYPNDLVIWIGLIACYQIENNPCWFQSLDIDKIHPFDKVRDLNKKFNSVFQFSFWLIKDCCPSFSMGFLFNLENKRGMVNIQQTNYSKSDGSYEISLFNAKEIHQAYLYNRKINNLRELKPSVENKFQGHVHPGDLSQINYNVLNKFERAIEFIIAARSDDNIMKKISWYIVAIESLFTIDITFKIKEKLIKRIQKFLNIPHENFESIRYVINSGYDLRSVYLHGSNIGNNNLPISNLFEQKKISMQLDSLLRLSFLEILNNNDKKELLTNKTLFDEFFN